VVEAGAEAEVEAGIEAPAEPAPAADAGEVEIEEIEIEDAGSELPAARRTHVEPLAATVFREPRPASR
jgi:hypothetical protein